MPTFPEPEPDAPHPTRARGGPGPHPLDLRLRKYGFEIHRRRKGEEAVWLLLGHEYTQSEAVGVVEAEARETLRRKGSR